jgi:hypothetical protein
MTQRITFENEDSLEVKGDGWTMRGEPVEGGYEFTIGVTEYDLPAAYRFKALGATSLGEALNGLRPLMKRSATAVFEAATTEIAFPSKAKDGKRWWQVWR